jgi:hypothetical protein
MIPGLEELSLSDISCQTPFSGRLAAFFIVGTAFAV